MHCSTNLQISPIIPRLPRACAFLAIVCLLVGTSHPLAVRQRLWLPVVTMPSGCWYRQKVRQRCAPVLRWTPLLARLLARCALLAALLYSSGWAGATPLSWGVLVLPVAQALALKLMPQANSPRRVRRWANHLQRLYQLLLVALLVSTLSQFLSHLCGRVASMPCAALLGTWHIQLDEETELSVTTLPKGRCQVTLRGTVSLLWEPRDSFERWILILLLRKLQRVGASRPFLTQEQVAEAFGTHQCEVSRWERQVRQHGWHVLSDRYRHQLHTALPDRQLSRKILNLWVPAFWLSAWDVRERLIAQGVIPDRAALTIHSLHTLAQHTGFDQVRRILLARFHAQDGQLIAKEHWWLNQLLDFNERLLSKLAQGESLLMSLNN